MVCPRERFLEPPPPPLKFCTEQYHFATKFSGLR